MKNIIGFLVLFVSLIGFIGCASSGTATVNTDGLDIDTVSTDPETHLIIFRGYSEGYKISVRLKNRTGNCRQEIEFRKAPGLDTNRYYRPMFIRVIDRECNDGVFDQFRFRTPTDRSKTNVYGRFGDDIIWMYDDLMPILANYR